MSKTAATVPAKPAAETTNVLPAVKSAASNIVTAMDMVPDFLKDKIDQDAGRGSSTDAADNIVPLIYVLQANSPQVNRRNPAYIEGAEPGDIWLRNAPRPIIKGDKGIVFQQSYFNKDWVEWVLRDEGGGFVARYDECPPNAKDQPDPTNPDRMRKMLPNGHEVRETRYHIGIVYSDDMMPMPYVIPLSSSGHTVSKNWMGMITSKKNAAGIPIASFTSLYKLTTKLRKNNRGQEWFTLNVVDLGFVNSIEQYNLGAALATSFEEGEKVIENVSEDTERSASSSDGEM